jgi:hypothetical protein
MKPVRVGVGLDSMPDRIGLGPDHDQLSCVTVHST